MQIKLTAITSFPGNYWLMDFSIENKQDAILLEKHGLICYQRFLLPVLFFNPYTQKGQLLVHQSSPDWAIGQTISVELSTMSPTAPPENRGLILASGIGIGYAIFLAKKWKNLYPLVLLEVEKDLPFAITPSKFLVKELPAFVTAGVKLCEDLSIVSRIASLTDQPGCFHGEVTELADYYFKKTPNIVHTTYRFLGTLNEN